MRTIRETEFVRAALNRIAKDCPEFERFYYFVTWRLARNPGMGVQVEGPNPPTYVIQTAAFPALGFTSVSIIYTDDGKTLEIVRFTPHGPK